jgi:hypothetical protein
MWPLICENRYAEYNEISHSGRSNVYRACYWTQGFRVQTRLRAVEQKGVRRLELKRTLWEDVRQFISEKGKSL